MKLLTKNERIYYRSDAFLENHYESIVKSELSRVLPDFSVFDFKLKVESTTGDFNIPDLAIVENNLLSWFIVEVELSHHSLEGHVFPQVSTFANGVYTKIHSQYIAGKLKDLHVEAVDLLIRRNPPKIIVVVESASVFRKGWAKLEDQLGAKITVLEIFKSESDDSIFNISGFLPTRSKFQVIRIRKHKMLNAFRCRTSPGIQSLHGTEVPVEYDGSIYKLIVTCSADETILFLRPSPMIKENRNYQLRLVDKNQITIEQET